MQNLSTPTLRELFDVRLLACLAVLGCVGLLGWDRVNRKFDTHFFPMPAKAIPSEWVPGATVDIGITVVTKDADRLACADDREFGGAHCEFKKNKERWPRAEGEVIDDNGATWIVPYRTDLGAHLIFVAGLWDTPAMAFRRHREPARAIQEHKLKRFVAHCKVEILARYDDVELRWGYEKPWYSEKNAPVGRAKDCFIE